MKKPVREGKGNHFYSHLIELDSIRIELDTLDLSDAQKEHLLELAASTTHHAVLDAIFSELSSEDKVMLLMLIEEDDHGKIWEHLSGKVENIDEKIKKTAEDLKKELQKDIQELKA